MKNKEMCKKCKYHGTFGSRSGDDGSVVCDYAATAGNGTCLRNYKGGIIDRRGSDPDKCLLFERGQSLGRAKNAEITAIIGGQQRKHRTVRDTSKVRQNSQDH